MTTRSARSGRYFSRLIVPSDLRQLLGRHEIVRSLRCSTYRRAKLLGARWEGRLAHLFVILRAHHRRMTKEQIEALVQHYLTTTLDIFEDFRVEKGRVSDEDLEGQWLVLSHLLDETVEQLNDHDYSKIGPIVDELLSAHGLLTVPKTSPAYKKLCRSILAAQQQAFRIEMGRLDGDYTRGDSGSLRLGQGAAAPSSVFAPTHTITEAVKLYFEHYTHRDKRTNEEKERVLQRFVESLPAKEATLLKDITKAHCIAFRNAYSQLPRRIPDKLRRKTVGEILAALKGAGYVKLTHSTVNHALTDLRHFFVWAIRHDHYSAGKNPVEGIDFEGVKEKSNEVYSDAELKGIFTHPEFLGQRTARPARYWLLWILLYTGARRSEVDQLDVADIRQESGVWFFDFRFNEEKGTRLKNLASVRRVPLHSQLIALGLLDYVALRRKAKQTALFEKPRGSDKRGKGRSTVGDAVGKWFARLRTLAKVSPGKKTLHSFRHTVVTRLTAAGVPQDMREMLVGHASESVHGQVYTHREAIPLTLLKEHLEKLKYTL